MSEHSEPRGPETWSLAELLPPDAAPAPPVEPYRPSSVGELVLDRKSGELVRYMGEWCGLMWVRPVGGGTEVPVHPDGLGPVPDARDHADRSRRQAGSVPGAAVPAGDSPLGPTGP
ncbi:hypothetical protein [Kitasatospora sp. NPDC088783]|uniref:hypothetical protein n=1 Tax=Kitasatospora sp. NPDC088783 TaxID=3364077 RepID=UPI00380A728F